MDIYDTSKGPFLWIKQYLAAKKLVVIPHSTLHRLAVEVGHPTDIKLTIINMTCRCGSTLLCQGEAIQCCLLFQHSEGSLTPKINV